VESCLFNTLRHNLGSVQRQQQYISESLVARKTRQNCYI